MAQQIGCRLRCSVGGVLVSCFLQCAVHCERAKVCVLVSKVWVRDLSYMDGCCRCLRLEGEFGVSLPLTLARPLHAGLLRPE